MGVTPPRSKRVVYTQGTKRRNFLFVVFAITFSTCAFISLSMGFGSEFRRHLGLSDWMQGPAHALFMVRRAAANASQLGEGVGGPERKEPSIKLKGTKKTPPPSPVVVTLPTAAELAEQEASRTISLIEGMLDPDVPSLTPALLARLVEWHDAGLWDEKTGGKLDPVAIYEAARVQAEQWKPHFRPRNLDPVRYPTGKIQILVLSNANDYFMRMDRIFFDSLEGLLAHPDVNVTMMGPGWHGWEGDHNARAEDNYRRVYGCDAFDIILFHQEHYDVDRCGNSRRAVIVQELGDCPKPCIEFLSRQADVITHTYASPLWEMYDLDKRVDLHDKRRLFVHNPHCANVRYMTPSPFAPRAKWAAENGTVTLLGMVTRQWYPFRFELEALGQAGGPVTQHAYAGWIFPAIGNPNLPRHYDPNEPRVAAVTAQMHRFAAVMKEAAVCAFDSQTMRLMLRKYVESMLVGCPIFATVPMELADTVLPAMFPVEYPFRYGYDLKTDVERVVADERGRALKGAYGMIAARVSLTCHSKAERWLDAVDEYRAGGRGVHFPFSRWVGCAEYPGYAMPHAWCYADRA